MAFQKGRPARPQPNHSTCESQEISAVLQSGIGLSHRELCLQHLYTRGFLPDPPQQKQNWWGGERNDFQRSIEHALCY